MKKCLAVLGRQPLISVAELEAQFSGVRLVGPEGPVDEATQSAGRSERTTGAELAEFESEREPEIARLGGTLKIAVPIEGTLVPWLLGRPTEGKITLGVSDYSRRATTRTAAAEALKCKRILAKRGQSVRVVPNRAATLSSATSFHNHLTSETKIELLKVGGRYYRVIQVQNINAYARRDQERPARDAKVGMLPPKLAQILINLAGELRSGATVLDPFCGTGVVLQEALLMGYRAYGTDVSERMVEYSQRNLEWLAGARGRAGTRKVAGAGAGSGARTGARDFRVEVGDATKFSWQPPIGAVAAEVYLGPPMSAPPTEMKLKAAKQECGGILLGCLRNLAGQLTPGTPVVLAVPAWRRPNGAYERLNLLDEIEQLGYNVRSFKNLAQSDLLYHREQQVVAREIIVLRKK